MTRIVEYGDGGLLVEPEGDEEARWAAAQALGASLAEEPPEGFVDVVASFRHVFVGFDPLRTDHATLAAELRRRLAGAEAPPGGRRFTVPVVYGGEHGPDLEDVAELLGGTPDDVVSLHSDTWFVLRFVASPVAAPFVEVPQIPVPIPRVASPRVRIPPGSVALSGQQSMIYPVGSPGGWRLIGRTPVRLFDVADADLAPYRPGDEMRFVPIPADEWDAHAGTPLAPDTREGR